jgi:hypothetical protein
MLQGVGCSLGLFTCHFGAPPSSRPVWGSADNYVGEGDVHQLDGWAFFTVMVLPESACCSSTSGCYVCGGSGCVTCCIRRELAVVFGSGLAAYVLTKQRMYLQYYGFAMHLSTGVAPWVLPSLVLGYFCQVCHWSSLVCISTSTTWHQHSTATRALQVTGLLLENGCGASNRVYAAGVLCSAQHQQYNLCETQLQHRMATFGGWRGPARVFLAATDTEHPVGVCYINTDELASWQKMPRGNSSGGCCCGMCSVLL